jgi:inorganic triphosphatase YgiF
MRKEIELKFEMTPRDLRKLRGARVLRRKPLKEENLVSVYFDTPRHTLARNGGYDLIENKPAKAVGAEKIMLQRGMNTADAFRIIGRSILRHIAGNETAVRRSDSEGVHQMRVGLRRMRAAISLFAKLLGDHETERVKSELKWLTGELAPARDLDVYMRNEIEPLCRGRADEAWNEGTDRRPDIATRRAIVRFYSTRCNGWKMEIGPSIRGFMDINPSNVSPRIFSRGVLRER